MCGDMLPTCVFKKTHLFKLISLYNFTHLNNVVSHLLSRSWFLSAMIQGKEPGFLREMASPKVETRESLENLTVAEIKELF